MISISPPIKRLGPWEVKAKDTIYQAATDGFVCASGSAAGGLPIVIRADDFTPPTTVRHRDTVGQANPPFYAAVGIIVSKGEYWEVEDADNVFWRAIGTSTKIVAPSLQDHYNFDDGASADGVAAVKLTRWEGETFTANKNYTIKSTKLLMSTDDDETGKTVTVSIRATSGGLPTGGDLCGGVVNAEDIPIGAGNKAWINFDFGAGYALSNAIQYAICVRSDETTDDIDWWLDLSSPTYAGGTRLYSNNSGVDWSSGASHDFLFETWGL